LCDREFWLPAAFWGWTRLAQVLADRGANPAAKIAAASRRSTRRSRRSWRPPPG